MKQNQKTTLFNQWKWVMNQIKMMNWKKFVQEISTPPVIRETKNEGVVSPRKKKLKSNLCEEKALRCTVWTDESTKQVHFNGKIAKRFKHGALKHGKSHCWSKGISK